MKNISNKNMFRTLIVSLLIMIFGAFCGAEDLIDELPIDELPIDDLFSQFNAQVQGSDYFEQEEVLSDGEPVSCDTEGMDCGEEQVNGKDEVVEDITETEMQRVVDPNDGTITSRAVEQRYRCTSRRYRVSAGYDELFLLDPTVDFLFPGAVLDGNTIPTGAYIPILSPRRPLSISASIRGATGSISRRVENPSKSSVNDAINSILSAENLGEITPPANSVFTVKNVYSAMGFGLSAGINLQAQVSPTFQAGLGLSFDFSTSMRRQEFLARFVQRYYTISIDLPRNPASLFSELPKLKNGISPVYISSITYGRMVLFNLKSYASETSVSLALEASLSVQNRLDLEASLGADYYNVLENSTVNSTVIGGAGSLCNGVNSVDRIVECIEDGGLTYSDAVPLAYTLRFLSDNSIASVVLTSEYTSRQCEATGSTLVPQYEDLNIQLKGARSSNNDGEVGNYGALDLDGDIAIRLTDSGPQSVTGGCNVNETGYKLLWSPDSSASRVSIGASVHDLTAKNLQQSFTGQEYRVFPNRQNLEICVDLFDFDYYADSENPGSGIDHAQIIDLNSAFIGEGETEPTPIQFNGGQSIWLQLYLYR